MTAGFVHLPRGWRAAAILILALVCALGAASAFATAPHTDQIPSPPATFAGSINDASGDVPAGETVEAYVGDTLCSNGGKTEKTGEGNARVTVYAVDVDSAQQTPGCGTEGATVTFKIGDRTAEQTGKWETGSLIHLDFTFGDVTPAPIPTFTPTPPKPTGTPVTIGTQTPQATIPPGSPGAGSPVPTLGGGVTGSSSPVAAATSDSGGGFPLWAIVAIVVGCLAALGGAVGYVLAHRAREGADADDVDELDDDNFPPSE